MEAGVLRRVMDGHCSFPRSSGRKRNRRKSRPLRRDSLPLAARRCGGLVKDETIGTWAQL